MLGARRQSAVKLDLVPEGESHQPAWGRHSCKNGTAYYLMLEDTLFEISGPLPVITFGGSALLYGERYIRSPD